MSRSWMHGDKQKMLKIDNIPWNLTYHDLSKLNLPKRKRNTSTIQWMSINPHEWNRLMMTKPQRAKTRTLLELVLKLKNLEEAPLFPLAKRPHVYYW